MLVKNMRKELRFARQLIDEILLEDDPAVWLGLLEVVGQTIGEWNLKDQLRKHVHDAVRSLEAQEDRETQEQQDTRS